MYIWKRCIFTTSYKNLSKSGQIRISPKHITAPFLSSNHKSVVDFFVSNFINIYLPINFLLERKIRPAIKKTRLIVLAKAKIGIVTVIHV